ncbi:hypothetical protein [Aneurinibacillus aneurinilyticus]|jgi:hypothetical protein|uniref:Uncharacterized protein n=3 Tax=Aneurinibacillus aneurinilyticus TaxID=1391 RepID=A0A848D2B6_ANEAE|nr:hypothetical protein [Aneurinibacillus aneurinilyticus]ERI08916.1 hypothetical protein HMPREF0083_02991 [Aneurinibacillus aneurinilyticus ATCC 12856]MCI1693125.1 hypothetical protein [Aneurinibacillus aneurinilyticus]MED0672295.1 hypothetical protein [Aneurinibacillus aneurinilyticus]MED0706576.1 hypothetical protein [Aneurinibacillus aneurinilyticus]MED0725318.1 hypothetical protein [Aneurinibacillus aneurinilyticus]
MFGCVEEIKKIINKTGFSTEESSYSSGVIAGLTLQFDAFKSGGIEEVKANTRDYYFLYIRELKQYRREYERGYKDGMIRGEKIILDVLQITC